MRICHRALLGPPPWIPSESSGPRTRDAGHFAWAPPENHARARAAAPSELVDHGWLDRSNVLGLLMVVRYALGET